MPLNVFRGISEYNTHFVGGTAAIAAEPFAIIANGTGAAASLVASVVDRQGIIALNAGTTTTGYCLLATDPAQILMTAAPWHAEIKFQLPVVSGATNTYFMTFGFDSGITGQGSITNGARIRIGGASNQIFTEVYSASSAVAGPNTETPFTVAANTWYKAVIDVGFVPLQSNLTYFNIAGPNATVRMYLGPDTPGPDGVGMQSGNQGPYLLGEFPVSLLPSAATGFIVGITETAGTAGTSVVQVDELYVGPGRYSSISA